MGQFSEEKFFVYMVHNTIIRVDVKVLASRLTSPFQDLIDWKSSYGAGILLEKDSRAGIRAFLDVSVPGLVKANTPAD